MAADKLGFYSKLLDISKLILPLALVFYFFGFLTVTSFLARFGIVSFDIINSRFIVAGIIASFAMVIVFFAAWQLAIQLPIKKLFSAKNILNNLAVLVLLPTTFGVIGNALTAVFNLGPTEGPIKNTELTYHILGRIDIVGHLVAGHFGFLLNGNFVVLKYTLLLSIYIIVPVLLIYILVVCIKILKGKKSNIVIKKEDPLKSTADQNSDSKPKKINELIGTQLHIARFLGLIVFAYLSVSFIIAFIYLNNKVIDFENLAKGSLDAELVTKWLMFSILAFYFAISLNEIPQKGVKLTLFKDFKSIDNVQNTLYLTLIPFLISIILFGQVIFPRIPGSIGGGKPREVFITFSEGLSLLNNDETAYFLGESSQNYFIAIKDDTSSRAVQVSKDAVKYMITRSK